MFGIFCLLNADPFECYFDKGLDFAVFLYIMLNFVLQIVELLALLGELSCSWVTYESKCAKRFFHCG
jgi:hypothetical protein